MYLIIPLMPKEAYPYLPLRRNEKIPVYQGF